MTSQAPKASAPSRTAVATALIDSVKSPPNSCSFNSRVNRRSEACRNLLRSRDSNPKARTTGLAAMFSAATESRAPVCSCAATLRRCTPRPMNR